MQVMVIYHFSTTLPAGTIQLPALMRYKQTLQDLIIQLLEMALTLHPAHLPMLQLWVQVPLLTAPIKCVLGNTAVTSIGGQVGWTIFSDGRFKKKYF